MTNNKKKAAAEKLLQRLRERPQDAQERRRARRDAELARLSKLRDEAKGAAREWLTRRLEGRREALKRAEKRRTDRQAKRAARRAKRIAQRAPKPADLGSMNAKDTIAAVATMSEETLATARAAEEAR